MQQNLAKSDDTGNQNAQIGALHGAGRNLLTELPDNRLADNGATMVNIRLNGNPGNSSRPGVTASDAANQGFAVGLLTAVGVFGAGLLPAVLDTTPALPTVGTAGTAGAVCGSSDQCQAVAAEGIAAVAEVAPSAQALECEAEEALERMSEPFIGEMRSYSFENDTPVEKLERMSEPFIGEMRSYSFENDTIIP